MTLNVGINGFGRMGRLVMRALCGRTDISIVRINDPAGTPASFAHLLNFDSVHGRWCREADIEIRGETLFLAGQPIATSHHEGIGQTDWTDCDLVIEASGVFKSRALLQPYLDQGVSRVVVTAPLKESGVLDVVMGVNAHLFDPQAHPIVTAASCTTNCLAPIVKVIHEHLGIVHGSFTTVHDITNTQSILDTHHRDLRRARASSLNLIPTTTGSATAITSIFPELQGKLNGHAIRVPLANASLTDCVFEVSSPTTVADVNALLQTAASTELAGIMGYEERPLVSSDYKTDPRSCVIDALSTMVINQTQVKLYAWYDNEWGYANRTAELARLAGGLPAA